MDPAALLGAGHQVPGGLLGGLGTDVPAVATLAATARKITLYTVVLVGTTLVFAPVADMGAVYVAAALILGAVFGVLALAVQRDPTERAAMRLFSYSITYVTLLFAAMIVDVLA